MSRHENDNQKLFSDYYSEDKIDLMRRKNLRLRVEEQLELKRLKEECKDDFDELNDEFDWDSLKK